MTASIFIGEFYSAPQRDARGELGQYEFDLYLPRRPYTRQEINSEIAVTLQGLCLSHGLTRADWWFKPSDYLLLTFNFPEVVPFA